MSKSAAGPELPPLTTGLKFLLAAGCGLTAANLYYAQPLLASISHTFHTPIAAAGAVPMACQIGYAAGLLFITPLGDTFNRRTLVAVMLSIAVVALIAIGLAPSLEILIFASLVLGVATCIPHTLIPLAVKLTKPEERGRTIGTLMSGLLLGILLSRTIAGLIGQAGNWTLVYWTAAALIAVLLVLMMINLPNVPAHADLGYRALMKSTVRIALEEPVLRQAAINGAFLFGVFSIFWSSLVFLLESPTFHLGPAAAGLFGLVGAAGTLSAPIIGRLSDSRSPRYLVGISTLITLASFLVMMASAKSLVGLVIGVILLDVGVQSANIANQARIYALRETAQSRIITVFMSTYFVGGAVGSILGTWAWATGGWILVSGCGIAASAVGLACHLLVSDPKPLSVIQPSDAS